jgi:hypothetical protein
MKRKQFCRRCVELDTVLSDGDIVEISAKEAREILANDILPTGTRHVTLRSRNRSMYSYHIGWNIYGGFVPMFACAVILDPFDAWVYSERKKAGIVES